MPTPPERAVLMCHAPIVLPEIAGSRAAQVRETTRAMREAAREVVDGRPAAVFIVSPHAPRHDRGWLIASDPEVRGDFGRFGVPEVGAGAPFGARAARALERASQARGQECSQHPLGPLDHGTLVPLWFLAEAGWDGPTVRVALPMRPEHEDAETMGQAMADAAEALGAPVALVASGDMSHRLTRDAPAGYAPDAADFDAQVVSCVRSCDYRAVRQIDQGLRERAAEDVVDSLDVAVGALDGAAEGGRVLSYEGPFGVGYLVAVLRSVSPALHG